MYREWYNVGIEPQSYMGWADKCAETVKMVRPLIDLTTLDSLNDIDGRTVTNG